MNLTRKAFSVIFLGTTLTVFAHDHNKEIAPSAERAATKMAGPDKTVGIESVEMLGVNPLGADFPALEDRVMRVRRLVVNPGGVVAVHEHKQRPGVAYILEGEIYEHRSDADEPILRKAGQIAFEHSGVSHWWENKSDAPVTALVVDIFPADTQR